MRVVICVGCGNSIEYRSRGFTRKYCNICRPAISRKKKDLSTVVNEEVSP